MADVTVQVIQGLEAGAILRKLPTPVTIGREEENLVQLNDERISRFHAKIQADNSQLILTDLQSTNGTRVNGHFTRMRTIQIGDQIALGRCILVIGSPEELATLGENFVLPTPNDGMGNDSTDPEDAFPFGPPSIPADLTPKQIVDLATLIEYTRTEVLTVLSQITSTVTGDAERIELARSAWHRLQQLPPQLSRYLHELVDPTQE